MLFLNKTDIHSYHISYFTYIIASTFKKINRMWSGTVVACKFQESITIHCFCDII